VFELYPKKKEWHDKSLFLMENLTIILANTTKQSEPCAAAAGIPGKQARPGIVPVYRASYLKKGNLEEAEKTFALAQERYSQLNKNQDISMLMAEIVIRRQGKAQAVAMLEAAYKTAKTKR